LIALTGYGHVEDRERATAAGFDDHLLKPASVEQLENVLARFLANAVR
jgi:CheY-like chemotaxis protein